MFIFIADNHYPQFLHTVSPQEWRLIWLYHFGLLSGHCISVLEASLQTLVQFQAVSQPDVIVSPIGRQAQLAQCHPGLAEVGGAL